MKGGLITGCVLQSFQDAIWKPDLDAWRGGGREKLEDR